ncbi:MAG: UDP-N-acetylmuramoyl-L-alanine--D-glutamate ligase [Bdellovibrionaceae bacterium]|nr:UDP-N-acetylmuramoyl-L-alanine--D-glutamate ligase [Pseudobdellovibrionaceae bacterium]
MGKSGKAAVELLKSFGLAQRDILTFDDNPGLADTSDVNTVLAFSAKLAVVSPGIPLATPWIQSLKKSGVEITSEISLTTRMLKSEILIGITGSVGKSTTTAALGAAALATDSNCFVGGNLGTPFSVYGAEVLMGKRPRAKFVILELSSFQLENCDGLALDSSLITFLSPNHLERYADLESYYETKFKIDEIARNRLFLNINGGDLVGYFNKTRSKEIASAPKRHTWVDKNRIPKDLFDFSRASLIGPHNQDNLALAFSVVQYYGWPKESLASLLSFPGLPHRLQRVKCAGEVLFVNDSKATALDSVITAVESCRHLKRPGKIHLLLGGRDKKLPWSDLSFLGQGSNCLFYFFGECREEAQKLSSLPGRTFPKLEFAVNEALTQVKPGDTVLLSPGGTSRDEFRDFEERGDAFSRLISCWTGPNIQT